MYVSKLVFEILFRFSLCKNKEHLVDNLQYSEVSTNKQIYTVWVWTNEYFTLYGQLCWPIKDKTNKFTSLFQKPYSSRQLSQICSSDPQPIHPLSQFRVFIFMMVLGWQGRQLSWRWYVTNCVRVFVIYVFNQKILFWKKIIK